MFWNHAQNNAADYLMLVVQSFLMSKGSGKLYRVVRLFPLVRMHSEEAFEAAEVAALYIFPEEYRRQSDSPAGWVNCNLPTTLRKISRRPGLEPWPCAWHSRPASCESAWANDYPVVVLAK